MMFEIIVSASKDGVVLSPTEFAILTANIRKEMSLWTIKKS